MEAQLTAALPTGDHWQYEPKWDGFRCLVFRDDQAIELQSKNGRPLGRYFPELVQAIAALEARRFIVDGEIIIARGGDISFDDLLQRIHPAASRIEKLSRETPAELIVFDLLADERGESLVELMLAERRPRLESFAQRYFGSIPQRAAAGLRAKRATGGLPATAAIRLCPATRDSSVATEWTRRLRGLDGIIAKRLDLPYQAGLRTGMVKVKQKRTADCVVGGFRYAQRGRHVGSLLLGLYDDAGLLHHVGFTSAIAAKDRAALTARLEKLVKPPGFTGNAPGGPSRWATGRSTEWQPLAPKLVVEVEYDHFTGGRFRHGTKYPAVAARQGPAAVYGAANEARGEHGVGAAGMNSGPVMALSGTGA